MAKIIYLRNKTMNTQPETAPAYSDLELKERTAKLVKEYNICKIYETGTYYGKSSNILTNMFSDVKIFSYELNNEFFNIAKSNNINNKNVTLKKLNSPDGLIEDVTPGENNVLFFLDAHWGDYWPILDELRAIKSKNIKPCIIIHDFYVPNDNNTGARFPYDAYKGQPLSLDYIKNDLISIYGENNFQYAYAKAPTLNTGVIYIIPAP